MTDEVVEGAPLQQQDCVDDVSVTISSQWGVIERTTYTLKDPPDYKAGDDIGIYFDVTNSSCRSVTVTVELKGSVSEATIHNADATDDTACLEGCTINASDTLNGNVGWDLSKHPNATGEKVVATITVTAPDDFIDANPENNSATSAQAINIVNEVPAPDIAVKSVTPSVTAAVIGETVNFTVKVENVGDADAEGDTTVTLHLGADTTELDSATASALAVDGESTVTLEWDTSGAAAGEHNLRVLAQTEGDGNSDNDSKTVTVALVAPLVDVAVKSVTASATEAVVGDTVEFTVTLENSGNVPAAWPQVSLFDANAAEDAEPLASKEAETSIDVGGTETVTVSWNTDVAEPGTYSLRAVATVANDDDSSNDSATVSLTLHDPVDVALSFTKTPDATAIAGNSVRVPFTVANSGNHNTGEVTVSLYVTQEGEERGDPELADTKTVPTIAVGDPATGEFNWDTAEAGVGDYVLEVVAGTFGDTDASNNTVSTNIEILNWLLLKDVSPTSAEAVTGDTVEFTAQVENVGTGELTDVTVGLYESGIDDALGAVDFASVATGDTANATIRWDTAGRDAGQVELFVAAGAHGQGADGDDYQSVNVTILNPIALTSASLASADNIVGSPVRINVQVLNESNADVTDISVALHVGDSEEASSTASIAMIAAGETVETSVVWDTAGVEPGVHELKIVAGLAGYSRDSNDAVSPSVPLRTPMMAVALTGVTIDRDVAAIGQTLNVVATVTNHGEAPAEVPVALYLVASNEGTIAASGETSPSIEPGSSAKVTLPWDSTGETVGTHTLKVAVELPDDTTADDNEELIEIEIFHSAFEGDDALEICLEDVRVTVDKIRDIGERQRSSPDYQVGEDLRIVYTVYNYSCNTDVAAAIAMTGPEDHAISDTAMLCFSNCAVPFGGRVEGEVAWVIPALPALSDQPITATVTVVSPNDFADVNEANNTAASTDRFNVVHPGDILLDLGEETGNKVSTRRKLTSPEFGEVDVGLVSAHPTQSTLPFAADTLDVVIEVANDGTTTEPAAVRFVLAPDDGTDPLELDRHTMVIPAGRTRMATVEAPLRDILPGAHTIEVLLSAAVDQSPDNNAAAVEITRLGPNIDVDLVDATVSPEVLVLGEDATVALTVQNHSEIALPLNLALYLGNEPQPVATKTLVELAPGDKSQEQVDWRVPASARRLGPNTLSLVASSPDLGAIATVRSEVTFHIDAEILDIHALTGETAMQGEEVTIEVKVQNNGPATVNVPITLQFPSQTKNLETRYPPVPSGSTEKTRFTWKTRDYAVGEHMLAATVPEQHNITSGDTSAQLPFQLSPLTITATIVDVTAYPETPSIGEPVSITVTVSNDGPVATRIPITLHFPPGGRQPETKRPHVAPGGTGTATFEWLTSRYAAGTHQFHVEVAAVNTPQQRFTIDLLPTIENVAIVGMGTYPIGTAMVGEPVEVWVEVRNDGPVALNVPVRLTLPSASRHPEIRSPRVEPGETKRVFFDWKTSNYEPSVHTLRTAILLTNNLTLEHTTEEIRFELTPLVIKATILDVSVSPEEPRLGDPVTVTVNVKNAGRITTNIPVTLHFPSNGKQPETRRPRIEAGATETVVFTWRTSHYEPGNHEFLVEVTSTPLLAHEFTVELLPPIVNVAIVGMGSEPSETAVQGQAVTIWVDVINNGPSPLNVPVRLTFPSSEKQPEQKSPRIEPGETVRVEFTWKTANYDAGVHVLTADLLAKYNITELDTSATIQIRLVLAQLVASIADLTWSPESPVAGEAVRITVTVRNDGLVAANIPVTLHFPSEDKQPETRSPRVDVGGTGQVEFTWLTGGYQPGDHAFTVEVASTPLLAHEFTVELLPPIVNVAIVGMGSDPSETAVQGQAVNIWVDVINNGPSPLNVPVRLTFPSSEKQPEQKSPRIKPGDTVRVEFAWKTANYDAGVHVLTADLLAKYNVTDLDTSSTIQIRLVPAQLIASIVDITWTPESPVAGEAVRITVTVRNDGLVAANIPVTLHFPSEDKRPETRSPRVDVGGTGQVEFTWLTGGYQPGDHAFTVEVASTPPLTYEFTVELLPPIVNVAIVGMGSDPSETAVQGQAVNIWVDVINNGPSALNVPVRLTFPSSEKQPEQKSPRIEPGETVRVEFTWKTANYDAGVHVLTADLLAKYNVTELDTSATIQIRLVLAQLVASIVDIAWTPESPVVGEPIRITVTVRNDGLVAANIPVTLHFPSEDKQPETRRPRLKPGGIGTAVFTWRTGRYEPGNHEFRVQIPGVAGAVREFEIELLPPAVDFAVIKFETPDPLRPIVKGDWVEITVVIHNRGQYAGRGTVHLLDAADLDTMHSQSASLEPDESRELQFIWKTLRYPVGEYELLVSVDAEHDTDPENDQSDHARVHLLTDRDITVGFGNTAGPAVFAEPTSEADLSAIARYHHDIVVVGNSQTPLGRPVATPPRPPISVTPKSTGGNHEPARMYWQWRSAQMSPWECARYQREIGESLPRAILCPKAPALVR